MHYPMVFIRKSQTFSTICWFILTLGASHFSDASDHGGEFHLEAEDQQEQAQAQDQDIAEGMVLEEIVGVGGLQVGNQERQLYQIRGGNSAGQVFYNEFDADHVDGRVYLGWRIQGETIAFSFDPIVPDDEIVIFDPLLHMPQVYENVQFIDDVASNESGSRVGPGAQFVRWDGFLHRDLLQAQTQSVEGSGSGSAGSNSQNSNVSSGSSQAVRGGVVRQAPLSTRFRTFLFPRRLRTDVTVDGILTGETGVVIGRELGEAAPRAAEISRPGMFTRFWQRFVRAFRRSSRANNADRNQR